MGVSVGGVCDVIIAVFKRRLGVSVGGVCDHYAVFKRVSFGSAALTIGHFDTILNMDPDENGCVGGRCL